MKNNTYTVKFFKDLINQTTPSVEIQLDRTEEDAKDHDKNNFLTFLFSTSSPNRT